MKKASKKAITIRLLIIAVIGIIGGIIVVEKMKRGVELEGL